MSIWRWSDRLDSVSESSRITLGEGDTPLVRSRTIGPSVGLANLFFKLDYLNPTGSYKDRFAAAAISHMVENGSNKCIATSSGNTGAALAAYCARAGIECRIAIVDGAPGGKLKQMLAYGAKIARVHKFGTDPNVTLAVMDRLQDIAKRPGYEMQVSAYAYSAPGMSGVQSVSFELAEQSAEPLDHVFCQAGGGGLCVAAARGFKQLVEAGEMSNIPAVECVQPEGNDTIASPLRNGEDRAIAVDCTTKISGLQVASVIDGDMALNDCRSTGGSGHVVTDEEVWTAQGRLAKEEGIFSEPAGAVALAGVLKAARENRVSPNSQIVAMITGIGFKDDASIERMNSNVECPTIEAREIERW